MRLAAVLAAIAGCGGAVPVPVVATAPPGAPRDIQVHVVDRRGTHMEVCWTSPADFDGGAVRGHYELFVARKAITDQMIEDGREVLDATKVVSGWPPWPRHPWNSTNEDGTRRAGSDDRVSSGSDPLWGDGLHATGAPGEGGELPQPSAPGQRDCYIVRGLMIETDYWFAVRAIRDPAQVEPHRTEPTS